MPIDPTKLAALLSLSFTGKPAVCAYWKVEWDANDANQTRYYSDSIYHQMSPFQGVGVEIEARIIGSVVKDTQFEINPDLRTETIPLVFDDIDKTISAKFQTFKSGVRCSLNFYYPDVDLTIPDLWFGQLQAPDIYGYKTIKTKASNGFRSREQLIGRRTRPRECTANFGAFMPNVFASETNLCPWDRHLGGSVGLAGQTDCPRDSEATCNTKLAVTTGDFFGGFVTDASATVTQTNNGGYLAKTFGNESNLKNPLRIIAGQKYVRGIPKLLWRREINTNDPPHGWVRALYEIGEGPIRRIFGVQVRGKIIEAAQQSHHLGTRGQPPSGYASVAPNFSLTAYFMAAYGWVDAATITVEDLDAECKVEGFAKVAVFSNPSTYTRQWCDDRAWWLFEIYTNQAWGMANPSTKFEIADWITASQWTRDTVSLTALFADGETKVYSGRRSIFDCIIEPRPVAEVVVDVCRSGAISVPFQHEGKYTITPFRPATAGELSAARSFTDTGSLKNIIWGSGQPAIDLSQTPDDKLDNEIELTFEDQTNLDVERPFTVDDPNQKLLAGRALGGENLHPINKRYSAFGIRYIQEVARLGYRILRFGPFDEGGTQNNLKAKFTTPFEQVLGLKRYQIIKIVSSLLDGFTIGISPTTEAPQYFRIQKMKKIGNGLVEIQAQAYNHTAYTAFETVTIAGTGSPPTEPGGGTSPPPPDPDPDPCVLTFGSITYDSANGLINLPIPPC